MKKSLKGLFGGILFLVVIFIFPLFLSSFSNRDKTSDENLNEEDIQISTLIEKQVSARTPVEYCNFELEFRKHLLTNEAFPSSTIKISTSTEYFKNCVVNTRCDLPDGSCFRYSEKK